MEEKKKRTSGGLGIVGVVQVVFLILKLCKVIDWAWIWVLAPMWIWAGVLAVIFMLMGLCYYLKETQ
jgi:hypothetical protein